MAGVVGACAGPVPIVGHGALWAQGCGQQAGQQPDRQLAGLDALIALRVFTLNPAVTPYPEAPEAA